DPHRPPRHRPGRSRAARRHGARRGKRGHPHRSGRGRGQAACADAGSRRPRASRLLMTGVEELDALRELYPPALERSLRKQLDRFVPYGRPFIELSPFFVLASAVPDGPAAASPRGGPPGFVLVDDERTLLVPDWPGNNRLDSLTNLVSSPGVGLLFL